ncbi:MAG: hypothetical protein RDU20_23435 [Desulfomonilaceae bacterium]|nr:hypothetical protein [Desulfomonilaceae bacterium]
MELRCKTCGTFSELFEGKVPIGRSFLLCPRCGSRVNVFKGAQAGAALLNLVGMRFLGDREHLEDRFCEPGEQWRVVSVAEPCPDRGKGKACEIENEGRCPNQRMYIRLPTEHSIYRTCLYRKGRKLFDKDCRLPGGSGPMITSSRSPR